MLDVVGWVAGTALLAAVVVRTRHDWLPALSIAERVRLAVWLVAMASVATAASAIVVEQAGHGRRPKGVLDVVGWGLAATVALAVVTALGGLGVLRARATWLTALLTGVAGGALAVSVDPPVWAIAGAMKANGVVGSCIGGAHTCEAFAYVAGYLAIVSPLTTAPVFLAAFALRRRLGCRR